jgi:hypothetical protein
MEIVARSDQEEERRGETDASLIATSTIPVRCYGLILLKIYHKEFEYLKLVWLYESELPFKHTHHFIILPLSEN